MALSIITCEDFVSPFSGEDQDRQLPVYRVQLNAYAYIACKPGLNSMTIQKLLG